jgi:hypothetical protein
VEELSAGRVLYRRLNGDFARLLLQAADFSQADCEKNGWAIVTRHTAKSYSVSTDRAVLRKALKLGEQTRDANKVPIVPWAILIGATLGLWIRPLAWLPLLTFVTVATACAYRIAFSCQHCNEGLSGATTVAWVGLGVSGSLAATLALTALSAALFNLSSISLLSGILVQFFLLVSGQAGCGACAIAGGVQALAIGSFASHWRQWLDLADSPALAIPSFHVPKLGAIAIPILIVMVWGSASSPAEDSLSKSAEAGRGTKSIVGIPVARLGISSRKVREVVLITASGCPPCEDALRFFSSEPSVRLRLFKAKNGPPGQDQAGIAETWLRGTPTLLLGESDGTISEELVGWNKGEWWTEAILIRLKSFLNNQSEPLPNGSKERK